MRFTDWLDAEEGRNKAVAEHFGLTPSAITHWRVGVPRGRMRELHALTQGAVDFAGMLPQGMDHPPHCKDPGPGA
jgi:hypothetical protein